MEELVFAVLTKIDFRKLRGEIRIKLSHIFISHAGVLLIVMW